jgi:LmbE family N-acetylglucosaminyl deacetylase
MAKTAFAIGAHPDDIEFMMAGTLLLLKEKGYEIHYMNTADGNCGTSEYNRKEAAEVREGESRDACKLVGATYHKSATHDLEVFYQLETLQKVGAVMREVNPEILLVPSPQDYMEDHINAGRVAVTAAFCMGMPNFTTIPPSEPVAYKCAVYHALPYGLHDQLRKRVFAGQYANIESVVQTKMDMLACHVSQKRWLDESQGKDAYLKDLESMSAEMGQMSGKFKFAEGWRRHSHLGFSPEEFDPLAESLGDLIITDEEYEKSLEAK